MPGTIQPPTLVLTELVELSGDPCEVDPVTGPISQVGKMRSSS